MKGLDGKVKLAIVVGAVLSLPVYRGWSDGTIPMNAALVRVGIAMALAYAGIAVVTSVVRGYLPKPEPETDVAPEGNDGVEDAVLVESSDVPALPEDAEAER